MSLVYLRFQGIEEIFLFIFKSCVAVIYLAFYVLGDILKLKDKAIDQVFAGKILREQT